MTIALKIRSIFLIAFLLECAVAYFIEVNIKNGPIFGSEKQTIVQNKTYYAFQGIPYAQSPVGHLRFAEPLPAENWTNPLNATEDQNECLQLANMGSEDCLYISVYTPTKTFSEKLPVMVWVYGGYFLFGGSDYNRFGPDYFLEEDVVIVKFNYRVGIFGFLSTQDDVAAGNWGLKDQILALKWVQDNVEFFGGNKESVTLFGQSAGACAISYLSQTSQTKDLYHRIILESGTALNLWGLARKPKATAFTVGDLLGINATDSTTLVAKLREIDAYTLNVVSLSADLSTTVLTNPRDGVVFGPTIESNNSKMAVITGNSHEKLSHGEFHKVPHIIGFNSLEGSFFGEFIEWLRLFFVSYDFDPEKIIPIDMNINQNNSSAQNLVSFLIKTRYFGLFPITMMSRETAAQFTTDDQFVRPIYEATRLMSQYCTVYFYKFSYLGDLGLVNRTLPGVGHSEELYYMWRKLDSMQNPPEKDIITRNRLIKLWTNFAKYSNPTPGPDDLLENITWNPVSPLEDITLLDIGENLKIDSNFENYSISFWKHLYDHLGQPPYDTY